ncbi:MAG: saccharopine dehydrogenase NADP-binding domain-containing protein [Oceanospirillaceae bacterium]
MKSVVVLGGYGNFGKRIVENLATIPNITIYIAGRNGDKSQALINELASNCAAQLQSLILDIFSTQFSAQLEIISPFLVIHTSGPFQEQDYRVPQACLACGSHYIDLADDRRFVCDISTLDQQAKNKGVLLVSGASSVPGLSSAIIDHYKTQFSTIGSIDIAIAPGNKAERGLATVQAILSYTGHPLKVFKDGIWQNVYGWMNSRTNDFGGIVGKRHLANVDVPDLELFPAYYNVKNGVRFQAGLELSLLHWVMVGMAYFSKKGMIKNWAPLSKVIMATSNWFLSLGTDKGAMEIRVVGLKNKGQSHDVKWTLYAPNGNGPYIPTLSTIILARKLLNDEIRISGAKPCVSLLKLNDFSPYFSALSIYTTEQVKGDTL